MLSHFHTFVYMLKARNIKKSYGDLQILKGVHLEVNAGEVVSIVGASGAGKSTLLHVMGGLDASDSGEVFLNGTNISRLSNQQLSAFRNKQIGFVFQFHHLLPEFTALENVCIPAFIGGVAEKKAKQRASELLDYFGLQDRLQHKPSALSGGEQQRVAIARALINEPSIVFADEPSGNLDSANAKSLHNLILQLRAEFKQTFVIVTHNDDLAAISDRVVTMKDGLVI